MAQPRGEIRKSPICSRVQLGIKIPNCFEKKDGFPINNYCYCKCVHPNLVNFHVYTCENVPGVLSALLHVRSALKVDEAEFLMKRLLLKILP